MKEIIASSSEFHLYVGFPFCYKKCSYCHYIDNLKFGHKNINNSYFTLLLKQIKMVLDTNRDKVLKSVYFGGGTPSLLSYSQILKIKEIFKEHRVSPDEISIEMHPSNWNFYFIDSDFFTRFSIGVQTIDQKTAIKYKRDDYDWNHILDIIKQIRENSEKASINLDFVFNETITKEEFELINKLHFLPESIVFYPNTKGRGKERLENILTTLKDVNYNLQNYKKLYNSNHIFINNKEKIFSYYSKNQHETLNDIIGVGHISISEVGDSSYLSLYDKDYETYSYKNRHHSRYLRSLIESSTTGVQSSVIKRVNSELMKFFRKYSKLYYIEEKNYLHFYNYLLKTYTKNEAELFLSIVNYGDSSLNPSHAQQF